MRYKIVLYFIIILSFQTFSQNSFKGKLTYKVYLQDTTLHDVYPPETMIIYTNDTLSRIETNTNFTGRQIQIKHLQKQKSILLVSTPLGKFGIQLVDTSISQNYILKKTKGRSKFHSYKTKIIEINYTNLNKKFKFEYIPKIQTKSIPGFENMPGLLSKYYVETMDGIYVYELEKIENLQLGEFLFKVPSDYKLIKIDDFIDLMTTKEDID